jgi:hypothetical protein
VTSDALTAESDYGVGNFHYVRAMDRLARTKAREIVACHLEEAYDNRQGLLELYAPATNLGAVIFNTVRRYPHPPDPAAGA